MRGSNIHTYNYCTAYTVSVYFTDMYSLMWHALLRLDQMQLVVIVVIELIGLQVGLLPGLLRHCLKCVTINLDYLTEFSISILWQRCCFMDREAMNPRLLV